MQSTPSYIKNVTPLFALFIIINGIILLLKDPLKSFNIDALVVGFANFILFLVSCINIAMHSKAVQNKNPNVIVRSIMAATMIKFFVVAISVVVYISIAGDKKNTYGIFCGMGVYVFYTFIESRIAMKLKNNGSN